MIQPLAMVKAIISLLFCVVAVFFGLCGLGILPTFKGKLSDKVGKVAGLVHLLAAVLLLITFVRGIIPAIGIGGGTSSSDEGTENNPIFVYDGEYYSEYDTVGRKGGEVWFKYYCNTAGQYEISVSNCDCDYDIILRDEYREYLTNTYSGDKVYSDGTAPGTLKYSLEGYRYYYIVVNVHSNDDEFTLNVKKASGASSAQPLSLGYSQNFSVEYPELSKWFNFTTAASGTYDVRIYSNGYVYLELYDSTGSSLITSQSGQPVYDGKEYYRDYSFINLNSYTQYYVKVRFDNYESSPCIKVSKYDPRAAATVINLGYNDTATEQGEVTWLKFTPQTTGDYVITPGVDANTRISVYNGNSVDPSFFKTGSGSDFRFVAFLNAGVDYYISLQGVNFSDYDSSFKFNVAYAKNAYIGNAELTFGYDVGYVQWLSFLCNEEGYYDFINADTDVDMNFTVYVEGDSDGQLSQVCTDGNMLLADLDSGYNYYVKVEPSRNITKTTYININKVNFNTLNEGTSSLYFSNYRDRHWYSFNTDDGAVYAFDNNYSYSSVMTVYDSNFNVVKESYYYPVFLELNTYDTYYICIAPAGGSYSSGSFNFTFKGANNLSVSSGASGSISYYGDAAYFAVTSTLSAEHSFQVSYLANEVYSRIEVYNMSGTRLGYTSGTHTLHDVYLPSGETYIVKVSYSSTNYYDTDFSINCYR